MIDIACLFALILHPLSVHHVFDNLPSGRRRQIRYPQDLIILSLINPYRRSGSLMSALAHSFWWIGLLEHPKGVNSNEQERRMNVILKQIDKFC